jgi:hypothetical protein
VRLVGVPFVGVREGARVTSWFLHRGETSIALPESIPDWDPTQPLSFECHVELQPKVIWEEGNLAGDARVGLCLSYSCEKTRDRGATEALVVEPSAARSVTLKIDLEGARLGGALALEALLVLLVPSQQRGSGASFPGSVLWSESTEIHLEGVAPRFPTEWADFELAGLPATAGWALEWDPDALDAPVLGGLRLLLNVRDHRIKAAVEEGSDSPQGQAVRAWIRTDVARQLIVGALGNESFVAAPESYEEGTLGDTILRLIRICFDGEEPRTLARKLDVKPATVNAQILASVGRAEEEGV